MAKLEDIIEDLRNEGREEDASELEKLKGSTLREKATKAQALETENAELKSKLEGFEAAPKRTKAFEEYGIDFENLSKSDRKVLEGYDGQLEPEAIGKFVEEFELPTKSSEQGDEEEEKSDAEKITGAARKAPTGSKNTLPIIKPEDTEEWTTEQLVRFRETNPNEFEALKEGKQVVGVARP